MRAGLSGERSPLTSMTGSVAADSVCAECVDIAALPVRLIARAGQIQPQILYTILHANSEAMSMPAFKRH
jgi:hypothetical protein